MKNSFFNNAFKQLQRLGPAMMPVIAIMPFAGLLYGFGAILTEPTFVSLLPFLGNPVFATISNILFSVGNFIMSNLALFFAISIAASYTKNDAIAGLSAAVSFFTMHKTLGILAGVTNDMVANEWTLYVNVLGINTLSMGVFGGIIVGVMVAWLFNKFKDVQLPQFISFFQGKRFVPIVSVLGSMVLAVALNIVWPTVQTGINSLGNMFVGAGSGDIFVFLWVLAMRLLLPFGLHTLIWVPVSYQLGTWVNSAGEVFHGAYPIFFAQLADGAELTTYYYLSGNYIMAFMFVALGCSFIYTAKKEKKAQTKSQIIPAMLTVGLTGISEPLEYSYVFTAFPAYVVHSCILSLAAIICKYTYLTVATGSWGGLMDFTIYGILQNNPTWIMTLVVGAVVFVLDFLVMSFVIKKFNFKTPGREDDEVVVEETITVTDTQLPYQVLEALGGKTNVEDIDACATRLRVSVKDNKKVSESELKKLGAAGVVKVGNALQVIFGQKAILLKEQIIAIMEGKDIKSVDYTSVTANYVEEEVVTPCEGKIIPLSEVPDRIFAEEMMGSGFAVVPTTGEIVSPINGKVDNIFPTKHAIAIVSDNGKEVLIHMGIDTVKLNGEPFELLVKAGDLVSTGTPIAKMDLTKIKEANHDTSVCVVFTNILDKKVVLEKTGNVKANANDIVKII